MSVKQRLVGNPQDESGRWLFVEPGRIGDWIVSQAIVAAFVRQNPSVKIDWCVRQEVNPLLSMGPAYDRALLLASKNTVLQMMKTLLVCICYSIRHSYDGICLLSYGRSAVMLQRMFPARMRFGITHEQVSGGYVYSGNAVDGQKYTYDAKNEHMGMRVLKALALERETKSYAYLAEQSAYRTRFNTDVLMRVSLFDFSRDTGGYVVLHTGSSWYGKEWPTARWISFCQQLPDKKRTVYLLPGPGEEDKIRHIVEKADRPFIMALPVLSLRNVAALLHDAELVISNDSGIMHLAAAVGAKVLALFGASNADVVAPLAPKNSVRIIQSPEKMKCAPCIWPSKNPYGQKCKYSPVKCMSELGEKRMIEAYNECLI